MFEMLKDKYESRGSEFEAFKGENAKIEQITKDLVVDGSNIIFLSYCPLPEFQVEDMASFYVLSEKYLSAFMDKGEQFHVGTIPIAAIGEELLEELKNTTGLMAIIDNEKYLVSDIAIPTLSIRASVSGNQTINRQNFFRNIHFADAIFSKNERIHFVYREVTEGAVTVKKIFAALGGAFAMVPQTILSDIAVKISDESVLGKTDVNFWSIDQEFSDLYLDFPEAADDFKEMYKLESKIVPGVFICTSDVGSSSIICRGVYRRGKSYVITDEIMVKHTKSADAEKIKEEIDKNIFSNIRKLPEALSKLIGEEIIDYSKIDITSPAGAEKNTEAVISILESTMKRSLNNVLPVKRQKMLLECLKDEVNSSVRYTLYDIADMFMSIPDRVGGLDQVTITDIRKAIGKVPYQLASKVGKVTKEDEKESEIYLLPA